MALKQTDRFLRIETALTNPDSEDADDNFVLIQARGAEGLSFPYAFDLSVIGPKDKRPDPAALIGTRARFGIKRVINEGNDKEFDFVTRHGMIETFAETGVMGDFRAYAIRLVPAFKFSAYETRFRVFEDATLEQILREVLRPYPEIELNTNQLGEEGQERIPYCVQFGESTFNFVHRLLNRFGVFYRFEHELNEQHEVMVVCGRNAVPPVQVEVVDLVHGEAGIGTVGGVQRSFVVATRAAHVGNFNELNPAIPFRGRADIAPAYDLGGHPAHQAVAFPVPATVPPGPRNFAERRMRQNEGGVFNVTGRSKNPRFRAGRRFIVQKDGTADAGAADKGSEGKTFILKTCTLFAFDHSALVSTGQKLFDMIKGLIGLGGDKNDIATAAAQSLLDQIKKDVETGKEIFNWLDKQPGAKNPSGLPEFVGNAIGVGGSALAGAIPLLISTAKGVKDLLEKFLDVPQGLAIAFEALPFDAPHLRDVMPTPSAAKPVAYGPHLAMVVGRDGISTAQGDIHTDALGRVRIRFPWDPGPDDPNDPLGQEAILTGRNTCFVRVSDGWAGERLGLQFIPRIGQEVVVGFIDGDPERPMVVGRAYNARGGTSHLPFLPASAVGKQLTVPDDLKGTETDNATRSGIRTKTTPRKPEGQSGFHMMRLDDKQGEEQFLIRSERRMDQTAFGSRFDSTRGNLHVLVGGAKEEGKPPPGGSIFTTAGGEYDLHVGKDQFENIDAAINITVKADKFQDVGAGWVTYAESTAAISADEIILQAKKKITLKVGASSVVVTPSSVTCDAAIYKEQQGGSPSEAPTIELTDAADAAMADPGEPPDFLARLPKGGGGPRRKHSKDPKSAPFITRAKDGTLQVGGKPDGGESGLRIKTEDPDFADAVADDLDKLRQTPEGKQKVDDAILGDPPVVITAPADKTDPPTAGTRPDSIPDATAAGQPTGRTLPDGSPEMGTGKGTGTTAIYDPRDWPREGDPDSPSSAEQLGGMLGDSAYGRDGTMPGNTFRGAAPAAPPPAPPPSPRTPPGGTP